MFEWYRTLRPTSSDGEDVRANQGGERADHLTRLDRGHVRAECVDLVGISSEPDALEGAVGEDAVFQRKKAHAGLLVTRYLPEHILEIGTSPKVCRTDQPDAVDGDDGRPEDQTTS